jgi:hypothetical protein
MTLTAKQQAQVAKASPARKVELRAMYGRQSKTATVPAPPRNRAQRASPPRVRLQQRKVPRPLGFAFDGFDKRHLPTDEMTAPYTTTTFINVMEFGSATDMDQVIVVCPRRLYAVENRYGPMTDYIAMRYDAAETIVDAIPILESTRAPIIDTPARAATRGYTSVRARLHNMSVKLECLGTNTGLYPPGSAYIGTVPMIEGGPTSTGGEESLTVKQAWAEDSIMVGYLKSLSAASLVEKPATLHASVAETTSFKAWDDFAVPETGINLGSMGFSTALEPIVIYIPRAGAGTTVVNYRVVIGQQWCSRHPHNIMLRSTQKQHSPTTPNLWHQAVGALKDAGGNLLQQAGGAAIDIISSKMREAYSNPAALMDDIPWVD